MDCWSHRGCKVKVRSGHEWKHFLKRDLVEGLPQKVEKVASSTWSTALERPKVDMAKVWPASDCLRDFQLPIE